MYTILLIEDNVSHARLIWKMLGGSDYSLISAIDGRQGLEIAQFCEPDVILLDMHLPDTSGERILRSFRDNPKLKSTPIIAVTADAMHGDRERLLKLGFDSYVAKPISRMELNRAIEAVIPQRNMRVN